MDTRAPTAFLVDDEADVRMLLSLSLQRSGFEVVGEAIDTCDGLRRWHRLARRPDIVLMDLQLPGGEDGIDGARRIRKHDPAQPVVLVTCATITEDLRRRATDAGIRAILPKTRMSALAGELRALLQPVG